MASIIFDMLTALLVGIVVIIICYALGMALLPERLTENKDRGIPYAMIAPVLGFSVLIVVVNFLYQLSFSDLWVTAVLFPASILIISLKRKKLTLPKSFPWLYIAIVTLLSCVVIYAVFPKMIDGGLYFTPSAYDHSRIALVNSIEKNGLPLLAPWSTNNGELIPVAYHYGIHVFMAYIADLIEMDCFVVAAGIHFVISVATILLIGAFTLIVTKKRKLLYVSLLLYISSSGSFGVLGNIVEDGDRFGFWTIVDNMIWCPHNSIASAMVILLIFLIEELLRCDLKKDSLVFAVLIGLVAAASAYCSVYSGAVAVFSYVTVVLIRMIFDKKLRGDFKRQFLYFALSVVTGAAFAVPYFIDLIKNAFHVPTLSFGYVPHLPVLEGVFAPLLMALNMYVIYLPIRIGAQYVFGLIAIIGFVISFIIRKRKKIVYEDDEFKMRLATFAIFSFAIIFFIHSSIYSNDFGWRTIFAARYIGIVFGSALLGRVVDWLDNKKMPIKIAVGLVLLVVCFADSDKEIKQIVVQQDEYHELHKELADIKDGWEEVQKYTGENDIVLCAVDNYQEIFPEMGSGSGNYMFSYYANRYSPMGDYPYAVTSGASMGQDRIDELHSRVSEFFEGNPTEEEVDYFADTEKVKAIFVVKQDGLYTEEGSIRSRYPHMIEGRNYKIYY